MDWKNLHGYIEVSPFLLFESTGDSEQDSDLNNSSFDDDNDAADDCQSCCSDPSEICDTCDNDKCQEYSCVENTDLASVHGHDYNSNKRHRNDYDEDEDEDDDDSVVSQECSSRNAGFGYSRTQVKKCKVYVESKMESIKNEEKDKLFWDACLAS